MLLSAISSFLLCLLLLFLRSPYATADADAVYQQCGQTGNYTAKGTYESNLKLLLSSLTSNGSRSGFSTDVVGQTPDRVYGLVLCRGDTNASDCSSCLSTAAQDLLQICPYDKGASVWYDPCLLSFSNLDFLSNTTYSPTQYLYNTQSTPDPELFLQFVNIELMEKISDWAAHNSTRRFATGEVSFTQDFRAIYGLVQCTPDLSGTQCRQCLQVSMTDLGKLTVINGKQGARTLGVRCILRYELYPFFNGAPNLRLASPLAAVPVPVPVTVSAPPQLPPPNPTGEENKKKERIKVPAIVMPLVSALGLVLFIATIYYWKRRSRKRLPYETNLREITSVESLLLDLSTLRVATDNFAEANKLGQGGFGAVYKGVLPDGQEIAVKRLSTNSTQGIGELTNELVLVAKLQHRNHVRLLGVSLEGEEKLLVYEYVPNRSLDTFLFDSIKREKLDWGIRYNIVGGIARGLLYLHEDSQLKIIHRDLKASNVLLDADMNPKISDFGLAKLFDTNQILGSTSRVVGTFGYIAPEYAMFGQFSIKSDVYSFGVLVLEIVTGRKNSSFFDSECGRGLPSYVWEQWNKGLAAEIIDPFIRDHCPIPEVLRCIDIGLLCVQENSSSRPSMSMVVLMLNSNPILLPSPSRPAFCFEKGGMVSYIFSNEVNTHGSAPDRDMGKFIQMSPNELSITELNPR